MDYLDYIAVSEEPQIYKIGKELDNEYLRD